MPGEENPELTSALEAAGATGETAEQNPSFVDDQGQGERLLQTSRTTDPSQNQNAGKFYNGKYKSIQDYDKSHRSLEQAYGRANNKASQLERLIQNPKLQELLAQDPEAVDILGKLGYELQQEETREDDRAQGGAVRWDPDDPRCQIAQLRAEMSFKEERAEVESSIGRKLAPDEVSAIKNMIVMAPKLTWSQAWKLTPQFEKSVQERQQKAIEAAMRRAPLNRPKPAQLGALAAGAQKEKKSPIGLPEHEKAGFIQDIIDKAGP